MQYSSDTKILEKMSLVGFFVGWPNPPNEKVFRKLLANSYRVVLAYEENRLIGFITAISDGVLSAYIPFLEVLPNYQGQGIGRELLKRMHEELKNLYMVDLLCDEELIPYYEKLGMKRAQGAFIRNYALQSGA